MNKQILERLEMVERHISSKRKHIHIATNKEDLAIIKSKCDASCTLGGPLIVLDITN